MTTATLDELIKLRDDFASQALGALLSSRTDGVEAIAVWAYQHAEAMLKVRAALPDPVVPVVE